MWRLNEIETGSLRRFVRNDYGLGSAPGILLGVKGGR